MLFNSYVFLFAFLPLVLVLWWGVLRSARSRLAALTCASYVFYAWFEFPRGLQLLPLLLATTLVDYGAGIAMGRSDRPSRRRVWLGVAVAANLGLLGTFKYLGFFSESLNALLALLGQPLEVPVHHLILPIGISFYTFNSMSYAIDVYRGEIEPERSLVRYSAFVAMFPHLIAGPIVRYAEIRAQLHGLVQRLSPQLAAAGMFFLVCGLVKKLVLADTIAPTVDRLFASGGDLTMVGAWVASIGFTLQLYFDFSGYSDMAVGLALLLGFRFPQNFDSPYQASSMVDLWRRWHMTLSRWLRDYLFVPLGGSRRGRILTLRNLFITMLLGGLWHGAAATYVVFGLGHGILLAGNVAWRQLASGRGWRPMPTWAARLLTYGAFTLMLAMFRAPTVGTGVEMWQAMFGLRGLGLDTLAFDSSLGTAIPLLFVVQVAALLAWVNLAPNTWQVSVRPTRRNAVLLGGGFVVCVLLLAAPSPFLYFRF